MSSRGRNRQVAEEPTRTPEPPPVEPPETTTPPEGEPSSEAGAIDVVVEVPMHTLNQVELIRMRILRGQMGELVRLRSYISILGGNPDAVDRLHGKQGDLLLARVTDMILRELGHAEAISIDDTKNPSKTRRAAMRTPE